MNLPGVPKDKQGREIPPQWAWTEAVVWTERMLETLEGGIKERKWSEMAKCLLRRTRTNLLGLGPGASGQLSEMSTTDQKAGCGKSASPVWREGRGQIPRSYPYRQARCLTHNPRNPVAPIKN